MLSGSIDFIDHTRARGWARNDTARRPTVKIIVSVNGRVVGKVAADQFRDDLKDAGIGPGWLSFEFFFPTTLLPNQEHIVEFRIPDGTPLPGSPVTLQPLIA